MRFRIGTDITQDEANAIASALATRTGETIELLKEDNEPIVTLTPAEAGQLQAEMTEREAVVWEEIMDIEQGGPERYRERLADAGKYFVRDRLQHWFGDITFEDGKFANHRSDERLPADGLLTGAAMFDDRGVYFMANDYSVKAGSMGKLGYQKFLSMQRRAVKNPKPVLYLMDSSGARIDQQRGLFANRQGAGRVFYNQAMLSGRVPQICVLYGPCFAGAAYTPVFSDFVVMVDGMSAMAIASPRMVEMVTGEELSIQELGGSAVHAEHSGSADLVADDEEHARELVSDLMSYLPSKTGEAPPRVAGADPEKPPRGIDALIPERPNKPYDMREVIDRIVDAGSFFELQRSYGKEILTGFARIDGRPVGVVANQPAVRSGAIFPASAEKATEFIWKCDAFEIPLLFLCDTPGFMAGSQVERNGILEKGKDMIYATSSATVQKQLVVVRKAYGAGIYAMSGPAYDPEGVLALPSAEIAVMGPEAAINAVYRRKLDDIDDPEERADMEASLREEYREDISVYRLADEAIIDELVPPSRLRAELESRFEFYADVSKSLPEKKHGTVI